MPFGRSDRELLDRISNQLSQLARDLAVVKQQIADQQHAIDQTRQDTTAAITSGLAEIRAVARDAMSRTTDLITGPLSHINGEIVAIRGALNQLEAPRTPAAPPPAEPPVSEPQSAVDAAPEPAQSEPQPAPNPEPQEPPPSADEPAEQDPGILRAAAGISAATLHAHRDTWEFLVKHAGRDQHFHLPAEVQTAAGTILANVSGPSLVAALTSLHHVAHTGDDPGTRAIAGHLHERLTRTVQEVTARPHSGDGADPIRIVIDDRAAPPPDNDQE